MNSTPPLSDQYNYAVKLSKVFHGNFSLDDIDIAENYLPLARLHPFTFMWLKAQYESALTQKTHPHFEAVKGDYQSHLERRINALKLFVPEKRDIPSSEKLLEADLTIQDVLFNCEELLSYFPDKAQQFGNEMDSFIKELLPTYLKLSTLLDSQQGELLKGFKNLQRALFEDQIEVAKAQLTQIRKELGGFAYAPPAS